MNTPDEWAGWPAGDGEMAGRIRAFDWASTPLGPVDTWPQPLKTAVGLILATPQPMWIAWGPDLIQLYNDGYSAFLDDERHPAILGRPAAETWADVWPVMARDLHGILAGGPAVSHADRHLPSRQAGAVRDHAFTSSYSPIPDPHAPSGVGGVLCISTETTDRVLAETAVRASRERQAFLLRLSDALRPLADPVAIQETAARLLGEHLGVSRVAYGEVDGDDIVIARDYVAEGMPSVAGRYRMADFGEGLVTALQEGRTIVVPDIPSAEQLSASEREACAAIGIAAITGAPLVKQGRFVASLNVHHREPRAWTATDIELLEETAERTWDAVWRARAEAALRSSEARFRAVWEATSDAIVISDPDGIVLTANPAYFELYGYDEEVIGHSFAVIFPEEQRAWAEQQYRDVFASPELPPSPQSHVRRKDGSERVVEARASFIVEGGRRVAMISAIRDVTSRFEAEEALRASEARLRRMINIPGVGVLLFSTDGTVLSANDHFLAMTGYSREAVEAGQLSWRSMTPPEHVAASEAQMRRLEREGQIGPYEKEYFRANGTRSWMLFAGASLGDGTIVEYCIDVNDRKLAEAALRESEARLQRVFSNNMVPMALWTRNGRIIGANDALLDLIGYTRADLDTEGLRWDVITPPEYRERDLEAIAEVMREGHCTPYEKAYRHRDGHLVPIIIGGGIFDQRSETGILFAVDLTERNRAVAALQESEMRFRAVAHLAPGLLWETAPDGFTTWYNDRWYEYTGQTMDAAIGWGWLDVIHPDDRERTIETYTQVAARGEAMSLEHRIRAADGSYRWFLSRAEPLRNGTGEVQRWFGVSTDVHEAREARDELARRVAASTDELRALSLRLLAIQEEERRHLARELHDEIGQVLTGLSLNLRPGMVDRDDRLEEARRIVHDLTNQVRQLSMDLRPTALDTHGLLPALVWHIERYQERTGVRVDLRHEGLDRRFPPTVEITAYRIVQEALTNIARHAGVHDATVQLLTTDSTLVVSVRDRGRGLDPSAPSDSSGLGGMRERVRLVGGTLSIESVAGKGTVVTAELPVDENEAVGSFGETS